MKKNLLIAVLYTVAITIVVGLIYPFAITGLAQLVNRDEANGHIITRNGVAVGSRITGTAILLAPLLSSASLSCRCKRV